MTIVCAVWGQLCGWPSAVPRKHGIFYINATQSWYRTASYFCVIASYNTADV